MKKCDLFKAILARFSLELLLIGDVTAYSHFQAVQLLIEMDPLLSSTGVSKEINKNIMRLLHSFLHNLSKGAPAKI